MTYLGTWEKDSSVPAVPAAIHSLLAGLAFAQPSGHVSGSTSVLATPGGGVLVGTPWPSSTFDRMAERFMVNRVRVVGYSAVQVLVKIQESHDGSTWVDAPSYPAGLTIPGTSVLTVGGWVVLQRRNWRVHVTAVGATATPVLYLQASPDPEATLTKQQPRNVSVTDAAGVLVLPLSYTNRQANLANNGAGMVYLSTVDPPPIGAGSWPLQAGAGFSDPTKQAMYARCPAGQSATLTVWEAIE